jgi:hypothetical protein
MVTSCVFWLIVPPTYLTSPASDYADLNMDYSGMVRDLLEGKGIVSDRYPPAFPLFLATIHELARLIGISNRLLLAVCLLGCFGLSSCFLYLIVHRVWQPSLAIMTVVAWFTYPPALYTTTYVASEALFIVFFYGSVYLFFAGLTGRTCRAAAFLGCGVLGGFAMLTRPIAIGVGVLFCLLLGCFTWEEISRRLKLVGIVLILLGNLLIVLPWECSVYWRSGRWIMLSSGGTPSILDGLTYAVDPSEQRNLPVPEDVRELQHDIYARQYIELQSLTDIVKYLATELRTRPKAVLKLFAIKMSECWYRTDSTRYDHILRFVQVPYLLLIVTGSIHAWKRGGRHRTVLILAWTLTLYCWMMTTIALSILRYMVPAIGLLFVVTPEVIEKYFYRSRQVHIPRG